MAPLVIPARQIFAADAHRTPPCSPGLARMAVQSVSMQRRENDCATP